MSQTLQNALHDRIVIFDGAMGTEIYRRNFFVNISFENLCLARPDVIRAILLDEGEDRFIEVTRDLLLLSHPISLEDQPVLGGVFHQFAKRGRLPIDRRFLKVRERALTGIMGKGHFDAGEPAALFLALVNQGLHITL